MKLHQLQALVHVIEYGSLRAAAESLHLTQAALSKSLSGLEEELETPLLIRHPRGVVLTPAGERLHERALLITRQIELARDEVMEESSQRRGNLRVAITPFLAMTALAPAFSWFRQRYPEVQLTLQEGLVAPALPALRNGSLDFAIVADSGDVPEKEFQSKLLVQVPQRIVVRAGHPVLAQPNPLSALAAMEWILPRFRAMHRDRAFEHMFRQAKISVPQTITRCDALIALSLLQGSDCVSILPAPLLTGIYQTNLSTVTCEALQPPELRLLLLALPKSPVSRYAEYFAHCFEQAIAASHAESAEIEKTQ